MAMNFDSAKSPFRNSTAYHVANSASIADCMHERKPN
jgi:hypothetical protein